MTDEELKEAARGIWTDFNAHDLSRADEAVASDYVNENSLPGTPEGPEGLRELNTRLWTAFPDMNFEVEEVFVAENRVAVIGWMSGTHDGQFGPFAPSGKKFRTRQIHTFRFDDEGLLKDHIAVRDDITMLQQLGHMPTPE